MEHLLSRHSPSPHHVTYYPDSQINGLTFFRKSEAGFIMNPNMDTANRISPYQTGSDQRSERKCKI